MTNPIIYVVLNGELKMSPGKAAAQAVHASMMLSNETRVEFVMEMKRSVIVLEAENTQQMMNLYTYLNETRLDHDYYIDEGMNEVSPYSATALAVGPIASDDLEMREILAPFPLYGGHIKVRKIENVLGYELQTKDSITIPHNIGISSSIAFRVLKKASK